MNRRSKRSPKVLPNTRKNWIRWAGRPALRESAYLQFGSNRILRVDLTTRRVNVIAGTGTKGHAGDGGPAKAALLSAPHEVRFDSKGNMYVAERDSHVVRHIDMKTQIITTVAGNGTVHVILDVAGYFD